MKRRLFGGVKVFKRSAPLRPQTDTSQLPRALGQAQPAPKGVLDFFDVCRTRPHVLVFLLAKYANNVLHKGSGDFENELNFFFWEAIIVLYVFILVLAIIIKQLSKHIHKLT
jgi:hypothetical protein